MMMMSWKYIFRFCFVLLCIWGQFSIFTSPQGSYVWRGDLTEGFLRYRFHWDIWRGIFSEFCGMGSYEKRFGEGGGGGLGC